MGRALRKTCSISMRPPTRWRTFAYFDFMRLLLPAARIRIRRFSIDYSLVSGEFGGRTRNSCYFRIRVLSPAGPDAIPDLQSEVLPAQDDPDRGGSPLPQRANPVPPSLIRAHGAGRDQFQQDPHVPRRTFSRSPAKAFHY